MSGTTKILWQGLMAIVLGFATAITCAAEFDLGEFELDEQQLKKAVYGQGFHIGLDEKAIDELMVIQEHLKQSQWVKAFRVIDAKRGLWQGKQVPRSDGFTLPVDEFLSRLVASLPAEAREAFNLYFSARAEDLLREARESETNAELDLLRRLYSFYFLTPAGADAANELGDAYFERGSFQQATKIWSNVIDQHTLSRDRELKLQCKLAVAFRRANDAVRLKDVCAVLNQRFAGEKIKLGSIDSTTEDFTEKLASSIRDNAEVRVAETATVRLPGEQAKPSWQIKWSRDQKISGFDAKIPAVRFHKESMIVSHGWGRAAYEIANGKRRWQDGLNKKSKGDMLGFLRSTVQRAVPVAVRTPSSQQEHTFGSGEMIPAIDGRLAVFQHWEKQASSIVVIDNESGQVLWRSSGINGYRLTGNLETWQDKVVAAAYSIEPKNELHLLFFTADGTLDGTARLGTVRAIHNPYRGDQINPSPCLVSISDSILVLPSDGAILAVAPDEQQISWMFRFAPPRRDDNSRFLWGWDGRTPFETYKRPSAIYDEAGTLFFRDADGEELYAINPEIRKVLWKKRVPKKSTLLDVDEEFVYVLTTENDGTHTLEILHRDTAELQAAPRLPTTVSPRIVVGKDSLLVSTNRGIYQVNKRTGDIELPYRTDALPASERNLFVNGKYLIAASDSEISAFELPRN